MSLIFFLFGQVCLAASSVGFLKENEKNAASSKFTTSQERILGVNTFSKSYSPFGNITTVRLFETVATNSGKYMTCGYIRFNADQSNALIGIINEDGSEVVQISIGNNYQHHCLAITQKKNGEIIALGNSNSE